MKAVARENGAAAPDWPLDIYKTLKHFKVAQVSYVPDAGHARLITLSQEDPEIQSTVLTSEEEGIALCAGAWLGGPAIRPAHAVERRRQLH